MDKKWCFMCQSSHKIDDFAKNRAMKDGRNNVCKRCNKVRCRKWYDNNKEVVKAKARDQQAQRAKEHKEFVDHIAERYGCQICGEKDVVVLQFHHIEEKHREVSVMKKGRYKLESLKKEINKCVVLCSNCHIRVHAGKAEVSPCMKCNV